MACESASDARVVAVSSAVASLDPYTLYLGDTWLNWESIRGRLGSGSAGLLYSPVCGRCDHPCIFPRGVY